jgi:hypothetical protein
MNPVGKSDKGKCIESWKIEKKLFIEELKEELGVHNRRQREKTN